MKSRPPRQNLNIQMDPQPIQENQTHTRFRRPNSASTNNDAKSSYAEILKQQMREKEDKKKREIEQKRREELELEQKIQQQVEFEKKQIQMQKNQQIPQKESEKSTAMANNSAKSSSPFRKDFRITKGSQVRPSSATRKSEGTQRSSQINTPTKEPVQIISELEQNLFQEGKSNQNNFNLEAHANYMQQLSFNLRELGMLRQIMEEQMKIQEIQMKNQIVVQQYKEKQTQIQADEQLFEIEMKKLKQIIKGPESQNLQNKLNHEIFKKSLIMSAVGLQISSQLSNSSKQQIIPTFDQTLQGFTEFVKGASNYFEKSYLKDLALYRKQQQQKQHNLSNTDQSQLNQFSQVEQEFIYPSQLSMFSQLFLDHQQNQKKSNCPNLVDQIPKILEFESFQNEDVNFQNEFL